MTFVSSADLEGGMPPLVGKLLQKGSFLAIFKAATPFRTDCLTKLVTRGCTPTPTPFQKFLDPPMHIWVFFEKKT